MLKNKKIDFSMLFNFDFKSLKEALSPLFYLRISFLFTISKKFRTIVKANKKKFHIFFARKCM